MDYVERVTGMTAIDDCDELLACVAGPQGCARDLLSRDRDAGRDLEAPETLESPRPHPCRIVTVS